MTPIMEPDALAAPGAREARRREGTDAKSAENAPPAGA
jgi:hypothetical protein